MRKFVLLGFVLIAFSAATAYSQNTDIEALSGIHFNFANPGARSLGMGGAFLGLADDASAAEANPAGLTILRKPEISFEGRNYKMAQDVNVTGVFPDLVSQRFSAYSDRANLSFASIVIPEKNYAVALYYQNPLNYHNSAVVPEIKDANNNIVQEVPVYFFARGGTGPISLSQCQQIIQQTGDQFSCLEYRTLPYSTAVDINMKTYGAAFAWKMGPLSLGLAARYQKLNEGAFTFRENFEGGADSIAVQATGKLDTNGNLNVKDSHSTTFSVGFKYQPKENFSIGGVYKQGAKFDDPTFLQNVGGPFQLASDTKFHAPDIGGLGLSFRPLPALTVNADAVHVKYSNLTDDFFAVNSAVRAVPNGYHANDVTEIHVGAEYFFSTRIPIAIRAGWWRDPAHSVTWVGPLTSPDIVEPAILFPATKTETHKSIGIGFAFPTFQVDAAYDTSELFKVGSLSAVFRF